MIDEWVSKSEKCTLQNITQVLPAVTALGQG